MRGRPTRETALSTRAGARRSIASAPSTASAASRSWSTLPTRCPLTLQTTGPKPSAGWRRGDVSFVRQLVPRSIRHGISAQLAKVHASRLASDLGRLAAGSDTIVVGPWLGEVGFELLYWVPFLRWFAATFQVAPERLLIVSRGGTAAWYRPFAAGYRDIFDYLTPEEFRQRHDERVAANGEQKQTQVLAFERQLLRGLTTDVHSRSMLHPSTMYRLFNPFWWGHVDEEWVHRFTTYQKLTIDEGAANVGAAFRRPSSPYTAVKFYFNDCFP